MTPTLLTMGLWMGQGSAWTVAPGDGTAAVFGEATFGLTENTDLSSSSPLFGIVSPNLSLKHTALDRDTWALAVSAEVGVPTFGLTLLQGTLIPSEAVIPWALTESLGLTASWRDAATVVSLTAEARAATPFGGDAQMLPLDLPFWDPMMAPMVEGPQARLRLWADRALGERLLVSAVASAQIGVGGPDYDGRVALTAGLTPHFQLRAGLAGARERFEYGAHAHGGPVLDARWVW